MKFVLAKNVDKPMVKKPKVEIPTVEKKDIGPKPKASYCLRIKGGLK